MKADPEFIPDAGVHVCEAFTRVRFHEVDALGHVNNAAYLNYLEQAAIDHAVLLGLDLERLRRLGGVFVARRHEVIFLRQAYAGDVLRIVTWLGEPRGARVERRYLVYRVAETMGELPVGGRLLGAHDLAAEEEIVVRGRTEWVFTSEQGKPRRIPPEVALAFRPDGRAAESLPEVYRGNR